MELKLNLEQFCYRNKASIALNYAVIGLGQCGGKIADMFASIKIPGNDNISLYSCIALNSYWGDLQPLKNIPQDRKFLLIGGEGCGRKPELCEQLLDNEENQEHVVNLITTHTKDADVILVPAGLGGGTGTGLIVPVIKAIDYYINEDLMNKNQKLKTIVAIVALPLKTDPFSEKRNTVKVLRELQDLLNEGTLSGIIIIDNNKVKKDFYTEKANNATPYDKWKDYGNATIVSMLHELNVGIMNHSDNNFDPRDLKNIFEDNPGCITLSKMVVPSTEVQNPKQLITKIDECLRGINTNSLADDFDLTSTTHAGYLLVKPKENELTSKVFDEIDEMMSKIMPYTITRPGSAISWSHERDTKNIIYTILKHTDLPKWAKEGLQKEYSEVATNVKENLLTREVKTTEVDMQDDIFTTSKKRTGTTKSNPFEGTFNKGRENNKTAAGNDEDFLKAITSNKKPW